MPSQTDLVNEALSHFCEKTIVSITEKSVEALTANEFYMRVLKKVLRDFSWPFATKYQQLNLVVTQPNADWQYAYQYPSDCLYFRSICSGMQQDSRQTRVPYLLAKFNFVNPVQLAPPAVTFSPANDSGLYIFTNWTNAVGQYTYQAFDPAFFTDDFCDALTYLLAARMVPRLTGGDPMQLAKGLMMQYDMEITKAKANSFNEEQVPEEPHSEFERSRNGLFNLNGTAPPWFPTSSGFLID